MLFPLRLHFLCPGKLNSYPGNQVFIQYISEGLRKNGHMVNVTELPQDFPFPSDNTIDAVEKVLKQISSNEIIIVDHLIASGVPQLIKEYSTQHHFINLFHLPLAINTGFTAYQREMLGFAESEALNYPKQILAIGVFNEKYLHHQNISSKKITTLHPGISDYPQKKAFAVKPRKMLCIADFNRFNGYVTLVKALAAHKNTNWTLDCYGDMDCDRTYLADLQALIRRNKLQDKIFIHGSVIETDLTEIFMNADLYLHPSEFEAFCYPMIDALTHGIPVVASIGGGTQSYIPASMGRFYKPEDVYGLQTIFEVLFENTEIYKKLYTESLNYKSQTNTWQDCVANLEKMFKSL